ncbi:hypothetical protein [Xanthobacter autotrophicus]|uniref:hypothetical protein n=2 Tax=Xanthobacter autotrophicus TaxID=280 RepID=UPI00372B017D
MNSVLKSAVALVLVLLCAACATMPKLDLSPEDIPALHLAGVKVTYPANASIQWPEASVLEEKERTAPNPELREVSRGGFHSYEEHRLAAALTTQSFKQVESLMQGTRPVRLEIEIRELLIPTTQERTGRVVATTVLTTVLLGGIAGGYAVAATPGIFMTYDVALVDQNTNKVLASAKVLKASSPATQFSGESVDSIAAAAATQIKGWLTQKIMG